MNNHFSDLGRYVSILDRLMKMYYNRKLSDTEIGWGQQFYVEYIYDHPGSSAGEMVDCIRVDKATLTKIVKKLLEIDYIKVVSDENDKRVNHLYLTNKAIPVAKKIKEIHNEFFNDLCLNISSSDIKQTKNSLEHMLENINQKVWHRKENNINE